MGRRLIGMRTVLGGGLVSAVAINAAFLQEGRHPAPLFAPRPPEQVAVPLPPRPALTPAEREKAALLRGLQEDLRDLGFYDGPVDGLDGPRTQAAISAYQKAQGLPATGQGDIKLLQHVHLANSRERPREDQTAALPPGALPHVLAVQRVLADLGYAPGPIDGVAGAATGEAIKRFEADHGLPVSGAISQKLIGELERISGVTILGPGEG